MVYCNAFSPLKEHFYGGPGRSPGEGGAARSPGTKDPEARRRGKAFPHQKRKGKNSF